MPGGMAGFFPFICLLVVRVHAGDEGLMFYEFYE